MTREEMIEILEKRIRKVDSATLDHSYEVLNAISKAIEVLIKLKEE